MLCSTRRKESFKLGRGHNRGAQLVAARKVDGTQEKQNGNATWTKVFVGYTDLLPYSTDNLPQNAGSFCTPARRICILCCGSNARAKLESCPPKRLIPKVRASLDNGSTPLRTVSPPGFELSPKRGVLFETPFQIRLHRFANQRARLCSGSHLGFWFLFMNSPRAGRKCEGRYVYDREGVSCK